MMGFSPMGIRVTTGNFDCCALPYNSREAVCSEQRDIEQQKSAVTQDEFCATALFVVWLIDGLSEIIQNGKSEVSGGFFVKKL